MAIAAVITISSLSISNAQESKPVQHERKMMTPEERAERKTALYKSKLNLDDKQAEKVKQSLLNYEKQKDADRANYMKKHEAFEKDLGTILNSEQQKKYAEMKSERKDRMKARMDERKMNKSKQPEPSRQ